jgi:hypothetical protein
MNLIRVFAATTGLLRGRRLCELLHPDVLPCWQYFPGEIKRTCLSGALTNYPNSLQSCQYLTPQEVKHGVDRN